MSLQRQITRKLERAIADKDWTSLDNLLYIQNKKFLLIPSPAQGPCVRPYPPPSSKKTANYSQQHE